MTVLRALKRWHYTRVYDKKSNRPLHPIDRTLLKPVSLIERITFNWLTPLMDKAQKHQLSSEEMYISSLVFLTSPVEFHFGCLLMIWSFIGLLLSVP